MDEKEEQGGEEHPMRKSLEELSKIEILIYGILTEKGYTLSRIRREVGDRAEHSQILDTLKGLLDGGFVTVATCGGHTIYKMVEEC
ncbi:MAG: hypothetical protein ACE5KV_05480 [Thermoplasmata archaeon]